MTDQMQIEKRRQKMMESQTILLTQKQELMIAASSIALPEQQTIEPEIEILPRQRNVSRVMSISMNDGTKSNLMHKYQSMDDSDIYSAVNSTLLLKPVQNSLFRGTSSRTNLVEYIRRKTSAFTRKETNSTC